MESIFSRVFIYLGHSIFLKNFKLGIRLWCLPFFSLLLVVRNLYNFILEVLGIDTKLSSTVHKDEDGELEAYHFQKKKWFFMRQNKFFLLLDLIYLRFLSLSFSHTLDNNFNFRIKSRLSQVNWSFYNNLHKSNSNYFNYFFVHYLSGLRYIWFALRYWLLSLIIGSLVFFYLTYSRLLPFSKVLFEWVLISMFFYWLISGFVFFIKKYQYSKFTSVIQRFWKRTYILFWIIESGTFTIFFFLTMNASEEPTYMYDQIKVFKTHLFSWRLFLLKLIPVISLIILGYYLLLSLKWTTFSKQSSLIVVLTLTLVYIFWLEFYQFFYIINYYGNLVWNYDSAEFLWTLDIEFKRTRIINNLTTICLLAKFWHLVFIFLFWIFFILRINEIGRIRYPLLAANLQNFIILYIMSWLYMYPWVKFAFKRHLETPYYWFFYNARKVGSRVFFNDIYLFLLSFTHNLRFDNLVNFNTGLFYYWVESSSEGGLLQYRKFIIRDAIISNLNSYSNKSNINLNLGLI